MQFKFRPLRLQDTPPSPQEVTSVINEFQDSWRKYHEIDENKQLHHYTSLGAMKKIIRKRKFWFSHASSLNDPLETKYGRKVILDVLKEFIVDEDDQDMRAFFDSLEVSIKAFDRTLHSPFIACFCETDNVLSQWRAYGDIGGGYSLGFQFTENTFISYDLENEDESGPPLLRKLIYEREEQEKIIKEFLNSIVESVRNTIKSGEYPNPRRRNHQAAVIGSDVGNVLLDMLLSFKHPAFKEEQEWRLIHITMDNFKPDLLKFRESPHGLIPYRSLNIFDKVDDELTFPLKTIGVGPSLDYERNLKPLKLLMQHHSEDSHKVKINAPYSIEIKDAGYSLR